MKRWNPDVDIWSDEHISQRKGERKGVSVQQRHQYVKVQDYFVQIDMKSFVFSFGAAHIRAISSGCWVCCVLTAPRFEWNQPKITSLMPSRLSCFVLHQNAIIVFTYIQTNQAKAETPSCFWTTSPINLGGKAPLDSSHSMRMVSWSHPQALTSSGP